MSDVEKIQERLESMSSQLDNDEMFMPLDDPDFTKIVELIKAESLSKKLKTQMLEVTNPSKQEVRMLVNLFYQIQDNRKAIREMIRSIEGDDSKKINVVIMEWVLKNLAVVEKGIQDCLSILCEASETGRWLLQIKGIGPVLAAGCLAYFDVSNVNYATNWISYAGLNDNNRPFIGNVGATKIVNEIVGNAKEITDDMVTMIAVKTQWKYSYLAEKAFNQDTGKWSKSALIKACAKIPYNRDLKTHMWKIGKSFQWLCNDPDSLYGRLFSERRVLETMKNEKGEFAAQAAQILATKNISKSTEAYKSYSQGKLPKAHINARCMRYVEKIFISHLYEESYRVFHKNDLNGNIPARYYALEHCDGHHDEIEPEVPYTC